MSRAALYLRERNNREALQSYKRQLIAYTRDTLEIDEYSVFEDFGVSANEDVKPSFERMMRELRLGNFSCVAVMKIEHLSRDVHAFSAFYEELKTLDVSLCCVSCEVKET